MSDITDSHSPAEEATPPYYPPDRKGSSVDTEVETIDLETQTTSEVQTPGTIFKKIHSWIRCHLSYIGVFCTIVTVVYGSFQIPEALTTMAQHEMERQIKCEERWSTIMNDREVMINTRYWSQLCKDIWPP
ncbi:hypothetical protein EDC01DRAFT_629323 [Geopyxis carbonaria]|nr:hypothetical protein EDC01DRAFT_629323 [Geopyxis carbonaria]